MPVPKGFEHSEETKRKMSEARKKFWASERGKALRQEMSDNMKGKRLPEKALRRAAECNGGKPLSKETKRKISAAKKGRKLSEEHKRKIGEANKGVSRGKGVKKSAEHKRKIGEANKGNTKWLGKHHSEKSKRKIGRSNKGKLFGTKLSKEHRRKIGEGVALAIQEGRFTPDHPHYVTGYHNSPKAGKVYYRSSLELEYYKALDNEADVKSYKVEPEAVNYEIDGRCRRYIPDLYVEYADGDWCIAEVKPSCFLEDEVVQAKVCAAEEEYGDYFEVWTELELCH